MGHIPVYYRSDDMGLLAPLMFHKEALLNAGYDLRFEDCEAIPDRMPDGAWFAIAHNKNAVNMRDWPSRSIVVAERFDGSQLRSRVHVSCHQVACVAKNSSLPYSSLVEGYDRAHGMEIRGYGYDPGDEPKRHPITPEQAKKVIPGPTFGSYPRMRAWLGLKWPHDSSRKFGAFFAGGVKNNGWRGYYAHREKCRKSFEGIPAPYNPTFLSGKPLAAEAYRSACLSSKTIVSPWGYGETCYRDFEAWLSGAVLIKPPMEHIRTWPERLYRAGVTYAECRPDFRDLPEVVAGVIDNLDSWSEKRKNARKMAEDVLSADSMVKFMETVRGYVRAG